MGQLLKAVFCIYLQHCNHTGDKQKLETMREKMPTRQDSLVIPRLSFVLV